jgi:hypothetical protein
MSELKTNSKLEHEMMNVKTIKRKFKFVRATSLLLQTEACPHVLASFTFYS